MAVSFSSCQESDDEPFAILEPPEEKDETALTSIKLRKQFHGIGKMISEGSLPGLILRILNEGKHIDLSRRCRSVHAIAINP